MEYRDDFTNAESAAIEAYTSMAIRHTMLLLLGMITMVMSMIGVLLVTVAALLSMLDVAGLHAAFPPIAVIGLACGGIDFIARRRDNEEIAGLATIVGQGALTAAGTTALLGWFSAGPWVVVAATAVGVTTSLILLHYPEWETQAQMLERFARIPGSDDDR